MALAATFDAAELGRLGVRGMQADARRRGAGMSGRGSWAPPRPSSGCAVWAPTEAADCCSAMRQRPKNSQLRRKSAPRGRHVRAGARRAERRRERGDLLLAAGSGARAMRLRKALSGQ